MDFNKNNADEAVAVRNIQQVVGNGPQVCVDFIESAGRGGPKQYIAIVTDGPHAAKEAILKLSKADIPWRPAPDDYDRMLIPFDAAKNYQPRGAAITD